MQSFDENDIPSSADIILQELSNGLDDIIMPGHFALEFKDSAPDNRIIDELSQQDDRSNSQTMEFEDFELETTSNKKRKRNDESETSSSSKKNKQAETNDFKVFTNATGKKRENFRKINLKKGYKYKAVSKKQSKAYSSSQMEFDPYFESESFFEADHVSDNSKYIAPNVKLSVSVSEKPTLALAELLKSEPYSSLDSIVIYVNFRRQADDIANELVLKGYDAVSYHAGKSIQERVRIRNKLKENGIRIVVATIAFGATISNDGFRCVIHFSMPKTVEDYIKDINSLGKDGKE